MSYLIRVMHKQPHKCSDAGWSALTHTLLYSCANPAELPACTPTRPLSLQLPTEMIMNSFQKTFSSFCINSIYPRATQMYKVPGGRYVYSILHRKRNACDCSPEHFQDFEMYSIHLFNYSLKSIAFRKPKSNYQISLNILKLLKMIQQLF